MPLLPKSCRAFAMPVVWKWVIAITGGTKKVFANFDRGVLGSLQVAQLGLCSSNENIQYRLGLFADTLAAHANSYPLAQPLYLCVESYKLINFSRFTQQ